MLLSIPLNSLLFAVVMLAVSACAPAFAPADDDEDGDLDFDAAERDEYEYLEDESDAADTDDDSENLFDNFLIFLDKNHQPADMGRQGQSVSDLLITFKDAEIVREKLKYNSEIPLFYTLDFGERIQVVFSKFDTEKFEFSEVDISISGLARTGDRQVSCYLENGKNSVDANGVFWVLPGQTSSVGQGDMQNISSSDE